ncbi:MAG TPA: hypothetical protein VFG42_02155 [Baekduia sp.]|uniref:hypothetical protein n=1 Tax=Baekduia sp. TaxID=2600305 RepID=UPI002D79D2E4|nr:hypothetical protein [Baekduia sp.]HET6505569.1 hypothetical protein [Baekduia sp.]
MIEDFKVLDARRTRIRPWAVALALIVSAMPVAGCGDSSSEADGHASSAQAKAASRGMPDPRAATAAHGKVRVSALRLGTPGKLIVSPKGSVPGPGTLHWYKLGTVVTIRAKDTRTARFGGWGGDCHGKQRVCRFKLRRTMAVVAGFAFDKRGAKGLKVGDPRLKVVVND